MIYRVAAQSWELGNGFGSHRVIVRVVRPAAYAVADIPLRRRDLEPERVGMRIVEIGSGTEITNASIRSITREACSVLFEAPNAGTYAFYYLPFTISGKAWYFPIVTYRRPEEMQPDPAWLTGFAGKTPEPATVEAVECRTAFDSFYPMEVPMTQSEREAFLAPHKGKPFLLVAEHRSRPVMMLRDFPEIWKDRKDLLRIRDTVARNELYAFQIAVHAFQDIDDLRVAFLDAAGKPCPAELCTCWSAGGTDCLGRSFQTLIRVGRGEILPLWCGIDAEASAAAGRLAFDAVVTACGDSQTVHVELSVDRESLPNKGDDDIARLSRLRWLDSEIGLNDEPAVGYQPVGLEGLEVSVLGRSVRFGEDGLPHGIVSYFTHDCSGVSEAAQPILFSPISLRITRDGAPLELVPSGAGALRKGSGSVRVSGGMSCDSLSVRTETTMEYDGHLDTVITVTAREDVELDDIALVIPYEKSAATYMIGMGSEGGTRPASWQYRWREDRANNCIWLGSHNAGLHVKLKHTQDVWEIYSYAKMGLPESWDNGGKGGATLREKSDCVELLAYSGRRTIAAGQSVQYRFSLIVTPLKAIDYGEHWETRYHHIDTWRQPVPSVEEAKAAGARAIILHQGGPLLPYINYPFYRTDELKEQVDKAHRAGLKYKLYYTVRELSNHAAELPALRALKGEVLREGPGFSLADQFQPDRHASMTGGPWLLEHLVEGFIPAWQSLLPDKDYDSALAMTGLSRWHNHYLEGLSWLVTELGIDGLYLDGVGYDRQIMKRVRKVMDAAKPGCLIDFHSGNNYDPQYGLGNPICSYLELMPSVDSLWLGEGYDYESKPADYWLVEVSGIPFGLMGEMLQNGGNPWRGMVFGMTCRHGWQQGGDPTPLWRFWDEYGISEAKMLGYWNPECPVSTSSSLVKATAYVSEARVIVAIASWEGKPLDMGNVEWFSPHRFLLSVDANALGLPGDYELVCPAISGFQEASCYKAGDFLSIDPAKGLLLVIDRNTALKGRT